MLSSISGCSDPPSLIYLSFLSLDFSPKGPRDFWVRNMMLL